MNIYKDTMPPIFVALRLTFVIFAGVILIVLFNSFTYGKLLNDRSQIEKKMNKKLFPDAAVFNKKELLNFNNRINIFFEAYDYKNDPIGYIFYYNSNDYFDNLKIAVSINYDMTIKNIKLIDNYRMINNIININSVNDYIEKIINEDVRNLDTYKNSIVFNINNITDYKNQIAFNSVINCLQNIYEVLKINKKI